LKDIILRELNWLKASEVDYADIRVVDTITESISTENLGVENISNTRSCGFGIRVIFDGSLGFASSQNMKEIHDTAEKALRIAKSSRRLQKEKIRLSVKDIVVDHFITPIEIDPFSVPLDEKIKLLFEAEKAMKNAAEVSRTTGFLDFQKVDKIFADTEGSYITQELYEAGGGIAAYATNNGDTQLRSYPNSFRGNVGTSGYEYVQELKLIENAPRIAKEVVLLVNAEECPSGRYDLIIDSDQMTLQIHESIGHPVELDRIFGSEAAYAGMSFVHTGMLEEQFRYGSEEVTVVADATIKGALGSFGYDDDGVKAQRTVIIDKGIIKNFISSRDTAVKLDQKSNGTNRADGWKNTPIVRMTNISLMPGNYELEELVAGVADGLYLCTNSSWSIDDKRINFQFATEIAYEIKNGKLSGKIYKNPVYSGITPEFWGSCDGVGNEKYWKVYGTANCGKGQPSQTAHVAHGSSPARFRQVKVGVKDAE
jgi:TldD protein